MTKPTNEQLKVLLQILKRDEGKPSSYISQTVADECVDQGWLHVAHVANDGYRDYEFTLSGRELARDIS